MTTSHHIRILTEVSYPDGPTYAKWDYFFIPDEEFPDKFRELPNPDELYDFLNDNGFWRAGWQEITEEIQAWLEAHDDQCGTQSEIAIEVAFI